MTFGQPPRFCVVKSVLTSGTRRLACVRPGAMLLAHAPTRKCGRMGEEVSMSYDRIWPTPWGWNDERERSSKPQCDECHTPTTCGTFGCGNAPERDDTYGPHCARRDNEPRESVYAYASDWPRCRCGVWCWCDPGQLAFMEDRNGAQGMKTSLRKMLCPSPRQCINGPRMHYHWRAVKERKS